MGDQTLEGERMLTLEEQATKVPPTICLTTPKYFGICGLALLAVLSLAWGTVPTRTEAEEKSDGVTDFIEQSPTAGAFTLVAYVTGTYPCPPCPPAAQCKPCLGDHITVADEPRTTGSPRPDVENLTVFVDQADLVKLEVGHRYKFRVEVQSTGPSSRVHLRAAEPTP